MTAVTLRQDEVTRVLERAPDEMPDIFGTLMTGWLHRVKPGHATYDLDEGQIAFVATVLPNRTDLKGVRA